MRAGSLFVIAGEGWCDGGDHGMTCRNKGRRDDREETVDAKAGTIMVGVSGKDADAGRHRDFKRRSVGRQLSGLRVDAEDGEVVPRHVRAEEPFPVGGDEEVLRSFAVARRIPGEAEPAVFSDAERRKAVVPTVRAKEEPAV